MSDLIVRFFDHNEHGEAVAINHRMTLQEFNREFGSTFDEMPDAGELAEAVEHAGAGDWWGPPPEVYTAAQWDERELEDKRRRAEALVAKICQDQGAEPGTLEMIRALAAERSRVGAAHESWNNPEVRAEQAAACRLSGVGMGVYFDDLNFENGRFADRFELIADAFDYIRETCPLLWSRWQDEREAEREGVRE